MATCAKCQAEVLHVRDHYTGATFPVDAEPQKTTGYELGRPQEGERNPRAQLETLELYVPHEQTCKGGGEEESSE